MKKAKAENFITRFARWYTPAVCIGALALAVAPPLFLGGWGEWLRRALTFLVISCPCALVISVPLAFFGGIGGASRAGIPARRRAACWRPRLWPSSSPAIPLLSACGGRLASKLPPTG